MPTGAERDAARPNPGKQAGASMRDSFRASGPGRGKGPVKCNHTKPQGQFLQPTTSAGCGSCLTHAARDAHRSRPPPRRPSAPEAAAGQTRSDPVAQRGRQRQHLLRLIWPEVLHADEFSTPGLHPWSTHYSHGLLARPRRARIQGRAAGRRRPGFPPAERAGYGSARRAHFPSGRVRLLPAAGAAAARAPAAQSVLIGPARSR